MTDCLRKIILVSLLSWAAAACAEPFSMKGLLAAQDSGKPVLVEVYADWCPTCARQKPVISELMRQKEFSGYRLLTVDFDTQKDALRNLRVQQQSTLLVFSGKHEQGRLVGETDRGRIAALLRKGL